MVYRFVDRWSGETWRVACCLSFEYDAEEGLAIGSECGGDCAFALGRYVVWFTAEKRDIEAKASEAAGGFDDVDGVGVMAA